MKTRYISAVLVLTSALCAATENRTLFVRHSGGIEPILYAEIDSIRFSPVGVDSLESAFPVVQEIWTPDTVYRFSVDDIVSVSFEAPETKAAEHSVNLAGEIAPYIDNVDYGSDDWMSITLSASVPENLVPAQGQYLYQLEGSDKLPYGFAGKVESAYGNTVYCSEADLSDIFDTLALNTETIYAPDESAARSSAEINPGWLSAEPKYPYGETVIEMTDELRDIPAGPAEARIDSKIRMRPRVSMAAGIYLLGGERGADGEWITRPVETHKIMSRLHARVEAHADGRAIVEAEHNLGGDKKVAFKQPFGLGKYLNVSFVGSMKLKGHMGLDYDYSAEYSAAAVSSVLISQDGQTAAIGSTFNNRVIQKPLHQLDASMEGSLTLSATLTASLTNLADSLKSVSTTYVYGTRLEGKALYLTSQLDAAESDNALYRRITSSGVKASPVETVTASAAFASVTLKNKSDRKPTAATTFYAVPLFKSPVYQNGAMSYTLAGTAMHGRKSQLGFAVESNGEISGRTTTQAVWEGADKLIGEVTADVDKGDVIYPTATLCDHQILGAPSYPDRNSALATLVSSNTAKGIRVVCGASAVASASNGKTKVFLGNLIVIPKPSKK